MSPVLETQRLALRHMTLDDVNSLLGIFSDPVAMRYYPALKNRTETADWIQRNINGYARNAFGLWVAEFRESGTFAGQCGLIRQLDVDGTDQVEIGYMFLRKHWNLGLATEAATACRNYGFETLGLDHLISLIVPDNLPSRRVAEKIGMHHEKTILRWDKQLAVYGVRASDVKS